MKVALPRAAPRAVPPATVRPVSSPSRNRGWCTSRRSSRPEDARDDGGPRSSNARFDRRACLGDTLAARLKRWRKTLRELRRSRTI